VKIIIQNILIISWITGSNLVFAACLEVIEQSLEEKNTDYGLITVEWSAQIHNQCNTPYDANLKIIFLGRNEKILHTAMDVVILQAGESTMAKRIVNIPIDKYSDIKHTMTDVNERERPL